MMSHEQVLLMKVGQVRTRIRLLLAQQWLCVGLTYAATAGLVLVAATRFQWWTDAVDYLWALLAFGAITGALIGWTRHVTPLVAAQIADERGELKERLSTAVELSRIDERSEIADAQIADAAQHAESIRPAAVLPWRAPRQLKWMAAALAVLLAAIIVPELPLFHSRQEQADREALKEQGKSIQRVAKELEKQAAAKKKKGDENGEIMRRIAQNLKQLGKDQERNRISKKQAMLKLNDLQKQVREAESKAGGGGKADKSTDQVAQDLKQAAEKAQRGGNAEQAKALQQMAENLGKKDFEGAKKQLEDLARKMQEGKLSPEDAKQMADTLEQMAKAMSGSQMQEASQQMKEAAQKLQQAAQQARQLQQQMQQAKTPQERQQLQQQMAQAMQQAAAQAGSKTQQAGGT